jgi:hypothetical protein
MKKTAASILILIVLILDTSGFAQGLQWPPEKDSSFSELTIIAPIYDKRRSELPSIELKYIGIIDNIVETLIRNPTQLLPDNYLQSVKNIKRQRWKPKNPKKSEENQHDAWNEILNDAVVYDEFIERSVIDNHRISDHLSNSYFPIEGKKSGLEIAIRINSRFSDFSTTLFIDGYRFIYQPHKRGKAEWFYDRLDISGKSDQEIEQLLSSFLRLKLILSFFDSNILTHSADDDLHINFWENNQSPGELNTESEPYQLESAPVSEKFYNQCQFIGWCPKGSDDDGFALVDSKSKAEILCSDRKKFLIRSDSLPFLLVSYPDLVEDHFFWVEDSIMPVKVYKSKFDYLQYLTGTADDHAMIWCQQYKSKFLKEFIEKKAKTILSKTWNIIQWHDPEKVVEEEKDEDKTYVMNGNHVYISGKDSEFPSVQKGYILYGEGSNLMENDQIYYYKDDFSFSGVTMGLYQTKFLLHGNGVTKELSNVLATRINFSRGNLYSDYYWAIGASFHGAAYKAETETGDKITAEVSPGLSINNITESYEELLNSINAEIGLERPVFILPGFRVGAYAGIEGFTFYQSLNCEERDDEEAYASFYVPYLTVKILYTFSESYLLFAGSTYTTSATAEFDNSNVFFKEVELLSEQHIIVGLSVLFQ